MDRSDRFYRALALAMIAGMLVTGTAELLTTGRVSPHLVLMPWGMVLLAAMLMCALRYCSEDCQES